MMCKGACQTPNGQHLWEYTRGRRPGQMSSRLSKPSTKHTPRYIIKLIFNEAGKDHPLVSTLE